MRKYKLYGFTRRNKKETKIYPFAMTPTISLKKLNKIINQSLRMLYISEEFKCLYIASEAAIQRCF